jgi:hypothetical protein
MSSRDGDNHSLITKGKRLMNLLNTEHFYDKTMNHCANYMVAMCNNHSVIALDMAKVVTLVWGSNDVIYAEIRFLCTLQSPANDEQLWALRRAIHDHGLINNVRYLTMRADRLENKGMHGVVVKLAIKPNRLSELHEDTRTRRTQAQYEGRCM